MFSNGRPAIALVDDDYHSARLMTRMLEAQGAPQVGRIADLDEAVEVIAGAAASPEQSSSLMAVVDLKSSSTATCDFVARLKQRAPQLTVVAIAPSLDRDTRGKLLDAGAAAVFERHADIALYRREAASIVNFWVRSLRPDLTGTWGSPK